MTAIQEDNAQQVRTVWPVAARFEPTQPDSNAARLHGGGVRGIGYCAPGDDSATRLARSASVSLWRVAAGGAIVPVDGAGIIDARLAAEGEVYLAPPAALADGDNWPLGDYFFAISGVGPGGPMTWLPLQLLPARSWDAPSPSRPPASTAPMRR